VEAFGTAHERTYGHRATAEPVELVNIRLVACGIGQTPRALPAAPEETASRTAGRATRRVYFAGRWCETPVLGRGDLAAKPLDGPLVVEEYDATTLVPPGWSARLGVASAIVLETRAERR
jgi:N-methylhydantoinase A